jgi:Short C-terminal domain/Phospholipase_D-nuclease N-terminal
MLLIASSYPLLDVFWTMLWFFLFFIWIWLLIAVFSDLFRSHDLGGWGKALWAIFIIVIPLLGVLIYLIARGGGMQQRNIDQAQRQQEAFRSYVQEAATDGGSSADQLSKLAQLRDQGVITNEEFDSQKAKILGSAPAA